MINYFKVFDLDEVYFIDQDALYQNYLDLQIRYHPDNVGTGGELQVLPEHSMRINDGFKVLKDDYLRAEHLLKLKGKPITDETHKHLLSQAELEQILEQHELIENTNDLSVLQQQEAGEILRRKALVNSIGDSFAQNHIEQVLELTIRLKYLNNLIDNIRLKIKHIQHGNY